MKKRIYLANPYGFSDQTKTLLPELVTALEELDLEVWEPFSRNSQVNYSEPGWAYEVGQRDVSDVKACDAVFAVVSGTPPDEGVMVELGIAIALQKPTFLFRDDFRRCTDSEGYPLNLMIFTGLPESEWHSFFYKSAKEIASPEKALAQWAKSADSGGDRPPTEPNTRVSLQKAVSAKDVRAATSEGIMRIYLIIIGLAVSEVLLRTFTKQPGDGEFLAGKMLAHEHLHQLALAVAFLFTVVRFAHGSTVHLRALGAEDKWYCDMLALLTQAILFFVTAIAIGHLSGFVYLLCGALAVDTIWIWIISRTKHGFGPTEKQWRNSNIALVILTLLARWLLPSDLLKASVVAVIAILAAVWDYHKNHRFYFPST